MNKTNKATFKGLVTVFVILSMAVSITGILYAFSNNNIGLMWKLLGMMWAAFIVYAICSTTINKQENKFN